MSAHTSYVCCIWTIVLCLWSHFFKNWFLKGNIQYLIFKLKYSYIYIFFNHTKKTQFGCVHSSPPHFLCHFLSYFCFLWDVAHVLVAFFQDRIKCCCRCYATLLTTRNTSTLVTSSHGLRLNIWLNCSLLESFLPTDSSLYEISDSRLLGFNWCFFICSSLHFRKRIQGFCLLCVSVWPLRGPWFQLRWSAQCIWGNMSRHINIQLKLIHHTTNTQNTFRLNLLIEPLSKKATHDASWKDHKLYKFQSSLWLHEAIVTENHLGQQQINGELVHSLWKSTYYQVLYNTKNSNVTFVYR